MIFNNFKIAYNMYFRLLMLQDLIYQATFLPNFCAVRINWGEGGGSERA